jgi:sensor histidine kinase YesM
MNDTKHIDAQLRDLQHNETQHNYTQQSSTQHTVVKHFIYNINKCDIKRPFLYTVISKVI